MTEDTLEQFLQFFRGKTLSKRDAEVVAMIYETNGGSPAGASLLRECGFRGSASFMVGRAAEISDEFQYTHLPPHLQKVSKEFAMLFEMFLSLPECEQRQIGFQKLLEAKDCFVRAARKAPKAAPYVASTNERHVPTRQEDPNRPGFGFDGAKLEVHPITAPVSGS